MLAFSPLFCVFACYGCTLEVCCAQSGIHFLPLCWMKRETNKRKERNARTQWEEVAKRMWSCMSVVDRDTRIHMQTHADTGRRIRTRPYTHKHIRIYADTYLMRSGRRSRTFGCGFFNVLNGDNTTVHANINSVDSSIGCDCVFSSGVCAT